MQCIEDEEGYYAKARPVLRRVIAFSTRDAGGQLPIIVRPLPWYMILSEDQSSQGVPMRCRRDSPKVMIMEGCGVDTMVSAALFACGAVVET